MTALFNRTMQYLFKIAGITICCITPIDLMISEESLPFLVENIDSPADITMRMSPVKEIPLSNKVGVFQGDNFYISSADGIENYFCPSRNHPPYAKISWSRENPKLLLCDYAAGQERYLMYTGNILKIMGLEILFLMHQGLLLHSSFIKVNSEAILFTAPSGTGKSTQAELWKQYESAEILNGDRAGLRKAREKWTAWGLPYAGSSGIFRNESAPIKAIVILRQGKENQIRRMRVNEAVRYIYPELTIHRWDQAFVDEALNLLMDVLNEVPVYLLSCLPNREAVQILKDELWGKG